MLSGWAERFRALLRDGQAVGGMEQELRGLMLDFGRQWLETSLNEQELEVPGDVAQPGERRLAGQKRVLHTLLGPVTLARAYYHDGMRQTGRYPLDDALGLVDGHTPAVASLIGRCAAELPFAQAGASFKAYTGLEVEARQFQRLASYLGPIAERFLRANRPSGEKTPPRIYVATDGTGAPLRHAELKGRKGRQADGSAQTHEIKVGAIFTQHPKMGEDPWRDLDSTTYVATPQRAEPFGRMMRDEFRRRFPVPPKEVVFLGDGAAWNWELQRTCFPGSLGIVDFYHAAEHVGAVAGLVEDRQSRDGRRLRRRWVKLLLRGKLDVFLEQARASLPPARQEEGEKALAYFEKNRERMRYGEFRDKGCFIGSGVVEAACKTVVGQRFKSSGMHWSEKGLGNILPLRTALLSSRFDEFSTVLRQPLQAAG